MNPLPYVIGEAIDHLPEPTKRSNKNRDDWGSAYRAARAAGGKWVPITMGDPMRARGLAAIARKRYGMEAESRANVCFLRVMLRKVE